MIVDWTRKAGCYQSASEGDGMGRLEMELSGQQGEDTFGYIRPGVAWIGHSIDNYAPGSLGS